jgi:hypothetical protein
VGLDARSIAQVEHACACGVEVGEPVDPLVEGQLLVVAFVGAHPEQLGMTGPGRRLFRVVVDPEAVAGVLGTVEVNGLVVGEVEVLAARRGDRGQSNAPARVGVLAHGVRRDVGERRAVG